MTGTRGNIAPDEKAACRLSRAYDDTAAGVAAAGMAAAAPQQAAASMGEETREAMASRAAMGFTDVDSNLAVLQKHSTVEAALDELLGSAAQGGAQPYLVSMGPVKPLTQTENASYPAKNRPTSNYDKVMKEARSILNKLTMTNFEKLRRDLASLQIESTAELRGLVAIIFDKALEEGHSCTMYAQLCNFIKDEVKEFQDESDPALGETKVKKVTFQRCLLDKCQYEFERVFRDREDEDEETAGMNAAAKANKTRHARAHA